MSSDTAARARAPVEEVAREIFKPRVWPISTDLSKICCYRIDWSESEVVAILRQHGYGVPWATKLREWFKGFMPAGTKVTDPQKFGEFLIQMASRDGDDLQLVANDFMEVGAQGQGVGPGCPKCGSDLSGTSGYMLQVFCRKCDTLFPVNHLSDFAQFFSPVPSPESATKRCEVCGATENLTVMGRNQYACPEHRATPLHGICPNCGADRSGPSAEAHAASCPESGTKEP